MLMVQNLSWKITWMDELEAEFIEDDKIIVVETL